MSRCTRCGGEASVEQTLEEGFGVGDVRFKAELPVVHCARCGLTQTDPRARKRVELMAARWLAERGVQSSETFRFMRKAIGMRASELAGLLGVQPETLSRWETGKRDVTRCALALLGSMVVEQSRGRTSLVDRLRALRDPFEPLPASVRLGP